MRVTLVSSVDGGGSGIGRYVTQLQRALMMDAVETTIAPFRYVPGADRRPVLKALPVGVRAPHGDIVHFTQIMGASVLLLRRIRPSVVTVHDLGALYCPEDQAASTPLDRGLLRLSLRGMRRANHIIAVSEFTRGHLLRVGYPQERVTVVHLGVDTDRFRPRKEEGASLVQRFGAERFRSCPIVLYVGNELPRKNLGVLVRALGHLKRRGVAFHWLKVGGPGSEADRVRLQAAVAAEGLAGDVTVVDHVPEEDLPLVYSAAAVYVQPSVWEGFGLPVLEAMACGAPVIASRSGSLPEICADAALMVESSDVAGMAAAIERVLVDRQVGEQLRAKGLRRVDAFRWSVTAAKTRDVYEGVSMHGR